MRAVLDALDVHYSDRPGWRPIRCPNPDHDDAHASASINLDEGAFKCHGCGAGGDAWTVIQLQTGATFVGAKRWVAEHLDGDAAARPQQKQHDSPFTGRRRGGGFRPRYRNRPFTYS